jgi:hypothetical protein
MLRGGHRGNEDADDLVTNELVDDAVVIDENVGCRVVETTHQTVEVSW